jgi:MFS transporter, ACS family, tartrate transporter
VSEPAQRGVAVALRRLLPLLVLMHVVAYLDRLNITFAETELSDDLALSATMFGLAAGIFFLPYVILEIPSNLALHRVGARRWMARIMVSWGIAAMACALAWNAGSLLTARILLGAAEAGFFPGVVYLIACWFPDAERAKAMGVFMLGIPIAVLIGGPFSGGLMELDGVLGLDGWQWLFIVQGAPAVAVGIWLLRALPDRPSEAPWLQPDEAEALERLVAAEQAAQQEREPLDLRAALRDRRVWRMALVYMCVNAAGYGTIFFLADIVERIGDLSDFEVGLISAIPFSFGTVGLLILGRLSDGARDRRLVLAAGMALGAAGLVGTAVLPPVPAIGAGAVATFGLLGAIPVFWGIPAALLSGRAAAGGIALVNSIGVTGGLIGPVLMGALKDGTGSLTAGLLVLSAVLCVGALLAVQEKSPAEAGLPTAS